MKTFSLRLLVVACALPSVALADGMFLPARGARPLGRAGSYVAGADDLEAIYYNPAGIAGTGHGSVLLDLGLVFQRVGYDHVDAGGVQQPHVDNSNGLLPLPLLGVSWRPDKLAKRVTFALGLFTPYTGLPTYPDSGPQRYSLVSLAGTALATVELAASIRVTPEFYIGVGFQNMIFLINNQIALSGCTALNCGPEDRNFDTAVQTKASQYFTPSGNLGLLYVHQKFRVGVSAQLPYYIRANGTLKTRLPPDPQFDGATVVGDQVKVEMNLPAVARAGFELRPNHQARVEVGFDYSTWQMQDKIRFTPVGVYLDHVVGIGKYYLRPLEIDRSMQGVWALHAGAEYDVLPKRLTVRAGYMFESSAVPDETLTVLTPDGDKHLVTVGLSVRVAKVRLDLGYGHFFQPDRTVTNSRSYQLDPIYPQMPVAVGNGTYQVSTDVLSAGIEGRF